MIFIQLKLKDRTGVKHVHVFWFLLVTRPSMHYPLVITALFYCVFVWDVCFIIVKEVHGQPQVLVWDILLYGDETWHLHVHCNTFKLFSWQLAMLLSKENYLLPVCTSCYVEAHEVDWVVWVWILYSHSACLQMDTGKFNARGNPAMD